MSAIIINETDHVSGAQIFDIQFVVLVVFAIDSIAVVLHTHMQNITVFNSFCYSQCISIERRSQLASCVCIVSPNMLPFFCSLALFISILKSIYAGWSRRVIDILS